MESKPVVLFVPEAGVYPFLRSICVIGGAMREMGHHVYITHCTGQLPRCPVKAMYNLPLSASQDNINRICRNCIKMYQSSQKRYAFLPIEMDGLLSSEDLDLVESLCTESNALEKVVLRSFHVGKAAQYDLALECKAVFSPELAFSKRDLYVQYVKNTALTQLVSEKICRDMSPLALITFNQYAQCEAVKFNALQFGSMRPTITHPIHKGANYSLFSIETDNYDRWSCEHRMRWPEFLHNPIPGRAVRECWDDVLFRAYEQDAHVYSPKKRGDPGGLYEKLRLDPTRKLVLALPSCLEERATLETSVELWGDRLGIRDVFDSQIVWLKALSTWASERDDVQLVVRIHPREGITSRDTTSSAQLAQFESEFLHSHEHCRFIWPSDPISSYDIAELADVACVSWSGMGMELMRMGVPMLGCTSHFHYIDSACIKVPDSPDDYFAALDSLLHADVEAEHVIQGCRYYFWRVLIPYLDLGKTVPKDYGDPTVWPHAPYDMHGPISDLVYGKKHSGDHNIHEWLSSLTASSGQEEHIALMDCIKFYLDTVFTYKPPAKTEIALTNIMNRLKRLAGIRVAKKKLCISDTDSSELVFLSPRPIEKYRAASRKNRNLYFISDGRNCTYIRSGMVYSRTSKQLSRLAKIAADRVEL